MKLREIDSFSIRLFMDQYHGQRINYHYQNNNKTVFAQTGIDKCFVHYNNTIGG
jgi:hypothetical protein